jgi:hypothetical protein
VLGSGSSLIGKSLKTEILREEVLELALEGFLPFSQRGEAPKEEKRSLFRELGLPYVTDPAVTRHLNAFLESAGQAPDAILFNGGFFIPEILQERVADVVGKWYDRRPEILENSELDLAVARGAAYYSYVRSTGSGVLVRGGLPRTYFIGLGDVRDGKFSAVCLVPRGAEEGAAIEIDNDALQLVANRPVSFRCTARSRAPTTSWATWWNSRRRCRPAHARAAECRDPLRQEGRGAADSGEAGRAADGDRHAGIVVRIENQRQSLAAGVRAAQGGGAAEAAERKAAAVVSEQALARRWS